MKKKNLSVGGYSLIELVIFGLLAVVFVQIFFRVLDPMNRIRHRQDNVAIDDIQKVGKALSEYIAQSGRYVPQQTSSPERTKESFQSLVQNLHRSGVLVDQVTNPPTHHYTYHYVSQYNGLPCTSSEQFCNYAVVWVEGLQSKEFGENTYYYYDPTSQRSCTSSKPPYDPQTNSIIPCIQ